MIEFTVALPVRDGWPYIKACVDSVLAQSYPCFELIILDNASTDKTATWLSTLSDPRIFVERSSKSLSIEQSWARIKTIRKKEFITTIGHDDLLDPGFLAAIVRMIEIRPDAALYQTGSCFIDFEGKRIRACKSMPCEETAADYLKARFSFSRDAFGTGFVMRSRDYDEVGGIPSFDKLFFADDALWVSLMQRGPKISDPRELFSVRLHSRSESASLPGIWRPLLKGLKQFHDFLDEVAAKNASIREIVDGMGPDFFLTYHRNALIFALIEACENGHVIARDVIQQIRESLALCASAREGELTVSRRVRTISILNASPFRRMVGGMWQLYRRLKT
ncbi:glycosyltransferase family 2 protein [Pseudolabrys sp.]|uniref:glycosyltransferase family 2 protein n=1 Tax=Pseudolabrys sp. TaxID=1960880 RepID=UPI003D0B51F1